MSVIAKLQIKPGQNVAVLGKPDDVHLEIEAAGDAASADAVLAFVTTSHDLLGAGAQAALAAARRDALAWVAYPKGGKLGTDLNRDTLAAALSERGVRPVRQIAVDDTWSALRFRPGD
ncbi:hypothetical protein AQI95_05285 [Streptomyces yokosukanensis]|uniref:DUF3052 domain-containing protein n=1 Tax=Streptomyces yokosukanensis TaxID=67386 RepID=A0A117Q5E1_9ACTN|nr:hypothetical protein [Streptomyces yokosukanensis]KUN09253.1 hypothetical protein AQI95_05285 [Streptomyces yokosukanensis]